MQISNITSALVVFQTVAAHTLFTTLLINDVNQGDGTCVRMPLNPPTATEPVNDLASQDMVCGFDGTKGVARVCPAPKGAKLSFTYRLYPDGSQPGVLDPNHKGPCAVYMNHAESAINHTGVGDGWFKVWEDGYDEGSKQWCTERLIQNNGILSVKIPDDLAGGNYLVRPEVLSLHESDKTPANPQFYVGCAQIFLDSPATTLPKDTVGIPGYVKISDPEVLFNIYTPKFPYKIPGPAVYQPGISPSKEVAATTNPTEGQLRKGVVLTNANWMGMEVPQFSTADGCEQAAEDCWAQSKVCYDTAPPTGSANCKIWEGKCEGIRSTCENPAAGVPSLGKVLTPPLNLAAKINDGEANVRANFHQFGGVRRQITATMLPKAVTAVISASLTTGGSLVQTSSIKIVSVSPLVASSTSSIASPSSSLAGANTSPPSIANIGATTHDIISIHAAPTPSKLTFSVQALTEDPSPPATVSSEPAALETKIKAPSDEPAPAPGSSLPVSQSGGCGGSTLGETCKGSKFGDCCSEHGYCGKTPSYCGPGCQKDFGECRKGKRDGRFIARY